MIIHRSGPQSPKTAAELRAELAAVEAVERADQRRIEAETAAREEAAASRREAERAAEAEEARVTAFIAEAQRQPLPQRVDSAHARNYDGRPLLDIDHITKHYGATIIGQARAYRITSDGVLVASDNVIELATYRIESQLMPLVKIEPVARLYAAWVMDKVNALADALPRDVEGASVLYMAKEPVVSIEASKEYEGLARIVCVWGDMYVSGLGE